MYRIFKHYIPKSLLMLGLAEALILMVSVYLGVTLHMMENSSGQSLSLDGDLNGLVFKAGSFALVMLGVMMAMGLYQRDLRDGPKAIMLRIGLSFTLGMLVMGGMFLVFPEFMLDGNVFAIALGSSFFGIASCRFLCFQTTDNQLKRKVLVLGVGERAQQIDSLRRRTDHSGVSIVGYVRLQETENLLIDEEKVVTHQGTLIEMAETMGVDEIVVALDDRRKGLPVDQILECKMHGIKILQVTDFYERQLGKIRLDSLHPSNFVYSDGFTQAGLKSGSKRVVDVLISGSMLIAVLPIMALTVLAIIIESGGSCSLIYRQERVGKNGKPFNVLKFRSMCENAEKNGVAQWAVKNDSRVTRVGSFIRKSRIDELPQLINVLRGDMSFVGPRPERPQFVKELSEEIPYYNLRHYVKPGITGWAQICYPYGSSVNDSMEKLQYDLYYLKNYSMFLDITILLQTATVILWGKGAR